VTVTRFPSVRELLPHRGEMVLLHDVIEHTEESTSCSVDVDAQHYFRDSSGDVPAWVGLEYLAQVIGVHAGLVDHAQGRPPRIGFLLGSRCLSFYTSHFRRGQCLVGMARRSWGELEGSVVFSCVIRDRNTGEILVEGKLNCMRPKDGDEVQRLREEASDA